MRPVHRQILRIAVPSIISNITVPLLGLVDMGIVGHLGSSDYIAAIAVGTTMFSLIYWIFGFLRMGTSGLTAQAYGKKDEREAAQIFQRSLSVGLATGMALVACQLILVKAIGWLIPCTPQVGALASRYFRILIWGAPAVLALYGFYGWFIGMQKSVYTMWIAILQNILNILVSGTLVFVFHLKIEGVAFGTLSAQYASLLIATGIWTAHYRRLRLFFDRRKAFKGDRLRKFFHVNSDIFFRTLCIVGVNFFFTASGAKQGTTLLAVNTLLMQFYLMYSYIIDGYAYAGEALVGASIGAGNKAETSRNISALLKWAVGVTLLFTIAYLCGGQSLLRLLTDEQDVLQASRAYFPWAVAIPFCGFAAFLWDGILVGAVKSKSMLYATLGASAGFFLLYFSTFPLWGNHALWLSFISYLFLRGLFETPAVLRIN